jgi:hypothetical protein
VSPSAASFASSAGILSQASASPWTPATPAGLLAWYKADAITGLSDGDPIGTWPDSSGNGRDLTQATAAAKPTYKTNRQNGLPGVLTDTVDDAIRYAVGTAFITGTTLTLAIVHKRHSHVTQGRLLTLHAGGAFAD